MSLSLLFLLAFPLFLLPSLLLPSHRLKVYVLSSLLGGVFVLLFYFVDLAFPEIGLVAIVGQPLLSLLSSTFGPEQTLAERCQVATAFLLLFVYLVLYLVSYLLQKVFLMGGNMTIHWSGKILRHIGFSLLFLLLTFLPFVLFFLNIRILLPIPDGFLSPLFQFFFPLEA